MSPVESEFVKLKERYKQAEIYEKTQYAKDTPEGQAWAEKTLADILKRMNELWNEMSEGEKSRHTDLYEEVPL